MLKVGQIPELHCSMLYWGNKKEVTSKVPKVSHSMLMTMSKWINPTFPITSPTMRNFSAIAFFISITHYSERRVQSVRQWCCPHVLLLYLCVFFHEAISLAPTIVSPFPSADSALVCLASTEATHIVPGAFSNARFFVFLAFALMTFRVVSPPQRKQVIGRLSFRLRQDL